jgi:hypothetical protein
MTERKLTDAEARALWREAERRLRLVDPAPPIEMARVDALLGVLGPRRHEESLRDWLQRGQQRAAERVARPSAEIIPFSPRRQRFVPVAEITRLAAASAGETLELPTRELETADGRFRLRVSREGDRVVLAVQALGFAADDFAGKLMGLAPAGAATPIAVVRLDDDGDGEVRLPDGDELRRALLKPVLGTIEDL